MRVRLTASKREKATKMIDPLVARRLDTTSNKLPPYAIESMELGELQKLTGYLQFLARITVQGHLYLHYQYWAQGWYNDAFNSSPLKPPHPWAHIRRRITKHMRDELEWWNATILNGPSWKGMNIQELSRPASSSHLWTDAATSRGIAGYFIPASKFCLPKYQFTPQPSSIFPSNAFFERPSLKIRKKAAVAANRLGINILELLAILRAIERWGPSTFQDSILHIHCENTVVINSILRRSTARPSQP